MNNLKNPTLLTQEGNSNGPYTLGFEFQKKFRLSAGLGNLCYSFQNVVDIVEQTSSTFLSKQFRKLRRRTTCYINTGVNK